MIATRLGQRGAFVAATSTSLLMSLIAFLALFGVELRNADSVLAPILCFAGFAAYVLASVVYFDHCFSSGRPLWQPFGAATDVAPAPGPVADRIRARAASAGLRQIPRVLIVKDSWKRANAYVAGFRQANIIVTGGLATALLSPDPAKSRLACFIVDHELGHIANRDVVPLYVGLSSLCGLVVLLPLKILANWGVEASRYFENVARMLPRSIEIRPIGLGPGEYSFSSDAAPAAGVLAMVVVYLLAAFLQMFLFRRIVHFREISADYFAQQVSGVGFHHIVEGRPLSVAGRAGTIIPQAFVSKAFWHPSQRSRALVSYNDETRYLGAIYTNVLVLIVLLNLVNLGGGGFRASSLAFVALGQFLWIVLTPFVIHVTNSESFIRRPEQRASLFIRLSLSVLGAIALVYLVSFEMMKDSASFLGKNAYGSPRLLLLASYMQVVAWVSACGYCAGLYLTCRIAAVVKPINQGRTTVRLVAWSVAGYAAANVMAVLAVNILALLA